MIFAWWVLNTMTRECGPPSWFACFRPDGSLSKAFAVGSVAVAICCTRLALILTTHGVRRGSEALDGELTTAAHCFTVLGT